MRPGLPLLLSEFVEALDDSPSWTRFHYLDRQTGEIATALTEDVDAAGNFADVRKDHLRYVRIDALPAWVRMQIRQRFVEQVEDPTLRLDLADALQATHAFVEFQRLLRNNGAALEAFAAFRIVSLADAAREWLAAHKVNGLELK